MKITEIKAGERVRVIYRFSNSLQQTFDFTAKPIKTGDTVKGVIDVQGSSLLGAKPVVRQQLKTENTVSKGVWDTLYSVYVTPDVDVRIYRTRTKIGGLKYNLLVIGILLVIALSLAGAGM
jgi:hypothetical protein